MHAASGPQLAKARMMWKRSIAVVASAVLLPGVVACDKTSESPAAGTQTPTVEKVVEQPLRYEGRTLTLSGEVDRVFSDRSFELESDDDPFDIWDKEILVLTRSSIQLPGARLEDDQDVVVTGTVRNLVVADVEKEIGWDLSSEIEAEYQNVPVLVASRVSRVTEEGYWTEGGQPVITSYTVITAANPAASLAGSALAISSVPVRRVADKALWVGYMHTSQLLVVPDDPSQLAGLAADTSVQVEGKLQKMPPAEQAIKQFGLSPALRGQIAQEPLYLKATRIARAKPQSSGAKAPDGGEVAADAAAAGNDARQAQAADAGASAQRSPDGGGG